MGHGLKGMYRIYSKKPISMILNDFGIQRAVKNGQIIHELGKNGMHALFYMICLISLLCLFPNGIGM